MIKKLLLGTGNPSKPLLYHDFLKDLQLKVLTPKDVGILEEPEETGKTLEENAILKAKYYFEKSGIPTLADDAGFEIPALDNFPGVNSRRFAGHYMTEEEVIKAILEKMKHLEGPQRIARMRVVCALITDRDHVYTANGMVEGHVPETPYEKRRSHMPYRSLLFVDKLNKWFEDMTPSEESSIGYRRAAVEELKKYITKK